DRFVTEKRRLEKEEEIAENDLLSLQQQLQERADEMLRRNVETLDDLEAVENAESFAAVEAQLAGAVGVIDWGEVFSESVLESGGSSLGVVGHS
ncbi:hypothetical protein ACHAPY_011766, partial [Fusarium culmorum]